MKIDPAASQVATPRQKPSSPASSQSFGDILTAAEMKREGAQRAFGFSELGMFGASGSAPAPAAQETFASQPAAKLSAQETATPEGHPAPRQHAAPGVKPMTTAKPGDRVSETSVLVPRSAQSPAEPGADAAPLRAIRGSQPKPDTLAGAMAERRLPRPAVKSKPLSLVLAERNGTLQVVAATGGMAPEARTALRKAAADVAAEFGVSLGEFTLDGAPLEPEQIGAPHGDRPR